MKLSSITKRFGAHTVLENFNLEIEEGKITAILGASGVGKTTLLNIIAGNIQYEGTITPMPAAVSYLFQEQRMLPHLTAEKNLEYVLLGQITDQRERKLKIENMLKEIGLYDARKLYPRELSGGMGQRLSMARAFLFQSELLLMDEPFKELDISLKKKIFDVFRTLFLENRRTTIFVTHDIDEALRLADRIILLGEHAKIIYDHVILSNFSERTDADTLAMKLEIYSII